MFQDSKTLRKQRGLAIWGGIICLLLVAAASFFKVGPEIWVVGAIALYAFLRVEQTREKQKDADSASWSRTLLEARPDPPRHETPEPPTGYHDRPYNVAFYWDFLGFAHHIIDLYETTDEFAWDNDGPSWRLHQMAETDFYSPYKGEGPPDYGFRYWVYCGQAQVGRLEIHPDHQYQAKEMVSNYGDYGGSTKVHVHVELFEATQIPFSAINGFLGTLVDYLASGSREEASEVRGEIQSNLLAALWDGVLEKEHQEIDISFDGTAQVRFFAQHAEAA